jgi:polyferredoxin
MNVQGEGTDRSLAAADVGIRVPRRPAAWRTKVRWARHSAQGAVIAVVGWQAVGHVTTGGESAEAWCPLGGFETLWTLVTTGRTVPHVHTSSLVLSVAVLVLALVGRGFFCGWLGPLGSLQEMVHGAGRTITDRVPALRRLRRRLERDASTERWRQIDRLLRWGRWLVLAWAIIGAAATGTMVFREADPWIALLSVAEFELSLAFVVLIATLVLALFIERPFCRYACPLGAVQSLAGKLSPIAVQRDASACLDCDLCNKACPMAIPVNTRTRVTDTSCTGCLECVVACPSQDGLTVTLAIPTFSTRRATPPTTEHDRQTDSALELTK